MKDDILFVLFVIVLFVIWSFLLGLGSFSLGHFQGTEDACASIQAEWRDDKCVRVVVEEVK
jgi:hypothetical protein